MKTLLASIALLAPAAPAGAQVLDQTSFDDGPGWIYAVGGCSWDVDALPPRCPAARSAARRAA